MGLAFFVVPGTRELGLEVLGESVGFFVTGVFFTGVVDDAVLVVVLTLGDPIALSDVVLLGVVAVVLADWVALEGEVEVLLVAPVAVVRVARVEGELGVLLVALVAVVRVARVEGELGVLLVALVAVVRVARVEGEVGVLPGAVVRVVLVEGEAVVLLGALAVRAGLEGEEGILLAESAVLVVVVEVVVFVVDALVGVFLGPAVAESLGTRLFFCSCSCRFFSSISLLLSAAASFFNCSCFFFSSSFLFRSNSCCSFTFLALSSLSFRASFLAAAALAATDPPPLVGLTLASFPFVAAVPPFPGAVAKGRKGPLN